uniref:Uncharacterized protein n=1 Tax=Arundo donax TaxID=35708 RepID=A0A0A9CYM6_ARUDO
MNLKPNKKKDSGNQYNLVKCAFIFRMNPLLFGNLDKILGAFAILFAL